MFCQALALPGQLGRDPGFVLDHKALDVLPGGVDGGPDHHLALPCHLQGQGASPGADESEFSHGSTQVKRGPV